MKKENLSFLIEGIDNLNKILYFIFNNLLQLTGIYTSLLYLQKI